MFCVEIPSRFIREFESGNDVALSYGGVVLKLYVHCLYKPSVPVSPQTPGNIDIFEYGSCETADHALAPTALFVLFSCLIVIRKNTSTSHFFPSQTHSRITGKADLDYVLKTTEYS